MKADDQKPLQMPESQSPADLYDESRGTILKDKEIARAIDIIGEYSHKAKKKILSGEVRIDKQVLQELSSWQEDDILRLAMEIENGSFRKKPPPASSEKTPSGVPNRQKQYTKTEIKEALKNCIHLLEKIYRNV